MIRAFCVLVLLALLPPARGSAQQHTTALFDGESLAGWEVTDHLGGGAVAVREGAIVLGRGDPLTGITWAGEFPRIGYEVELEAMRVEGRDFFSAITFPVGDAYCTLVIGGWGGSVVGLSSIEGADASENETRREMQFEDGRWYPVRLRVTDRRIEAWIDGEQVVDLAHRGRLLSVRVEMLASQPFGVATWMTTGALRGIRLHALDAQAAAEVLPP